MVPYKEMVEVIQRKHPDFQRVLHEDEENDTSKAWTVPGFEGRLHLPFFIYNQTSVISVLKFHSICRQGGIHHLHEPKLLWVVQPVEAHS